MDNLMILTALKGFLLSATFIIAIGLQNAFILRQGIIKRHIFAVALTASIIDAGLIIAGILGLGALIESNPALLQWIRWGGAAFLTVYGLRSLYSAFKAHRLDSDKAKGMVGSGTLVQTLAALMGVSLLNPHVYLDTVILLGGLAAAEGDPGKYIFGAGAATASFVWFFGLAYGARLLAPLFENPRAWQILDIFIGIIMLGIAASLIWH